MKNRWTYLYVQLLLMMLVAMAVSVIPEHAHDLFGDWHCAGSGKKIPNTQVYEPCSYGNREFHRPTWHWGFRHWIWLLFGFAFWIVNIARMISGWEARKK